MMDAIQELKPDQYFLTDGFKLYPANAEEAIKSSVNIQEKLGIYLNLDSGAFDPDNAGSYDPDYHLRWITSREHLLSQVGITTEVGLRLSDHESIVSIGFEFIEKLIYDAMGKTPFNWVDGIPDEPFKVGTDQFNRVSSHPWIQRHVVATWNTDELIRANARHRQLLPYAKSTSMRELAKFTQLSSELLSRWFITNGLAIPAQEDDEIIDSKINIERSDELIHQFEGASENNRAGSDYIFRHQDDEWIFRFRGGHQFKFQGKKNNLDGFFYISVLLAKPDDIANTASLYWSRQNINFVNIEVDNRSPITQTAKGVDTVIDDRTKAQVLKSVRELEEDLELAKMENDQNLIDSINETLFVNRKYFRAAVDPTGTTRPLGKDSHQPYRNVLKAKNRAIDAIRPLHPALADHLIISIDIKPSGSAYRSDIQPTPLSSL